MDKKVNCSCGKLIAVERDGKIYIKCRGCKHEVLVPLITDKKPKI